MRRFVSSILAAAVLAAGCNTFPTVDPASWPSRYESYMTVLTKAYTAANVGMIVGKVDKDGAAKVLREMQDVEDLAAAGLLMWGPVPGADKLTADHKAARDALQAAVKAP